MAITPNENVQQNIASNGANSEKLSNSQLFNVEVWFNNYTSEPFQLPQSLILEMVIEEDIFNWANRGYMIYDNSNEMFERNTNNNAFFYRMDGRDEISIKIKIVPDKPTENPFTPEVWEMDLTFVIYNTEDLPETNIKNKTKKIYFWDKRYQMMKEKNKQWSTATANNIPFPSHATDKERRMLTGDAIKYLLTNENTANYTDAIDTEYWDRGGADAFYTSPATSSLENDLESLLGIHVSEKNDDFCIFKYKNRIDPKWQLIPMNKVFENAGKIPAKKDIYGKIISNTGPGKFALELFYFENISPVEQGKTTPLRSPHLRDFNFTIDIKIAEWNKISTYEFTDMAGIDNSLALVSRPVYSYFPKYHQFSVDYTDNEISNVKTDFQNLYVKNLAPNGVGDANLTLNKTKTNQVNVEPQFLMSSWGNFENKVQRVFLGKGKTLRGGVFMNEFIKFTVNGSPHRTIGRFIGINREDTSLDIKFDNKICGQWFITNVKHIWTHNRYINHIGAVKVHLYESNKVNEDIE